MTSKNGNGTHPADEWVIDLNAIKAKEIADFQFAFDAIGAQGGLDAFWPWAVRIVKKWPFEYDPAAVESYGEIGMVDLQELVFRLGKSFRGFIEKTESVTNSLEVSSEGDSAGRPEGA